MVPPPSADAIAALERERDEARKRVADLEAQAKAAAAQASAKQAELIEANRRAESALEELKKTSAARTAQTQEELSAARASLALLQETVRRLEADRSAASSKDEASARLAEERAREVAALKDELAKALARVKEAGEQKDAALAAASSQASAKASEAAEKIRRAETALAEQEKAAAANAARWQGEIDAARKQVADLQEEFQRMRAEKSSASSKQSAQEAALSVLRSERDALLAQVKTSSSLAGAVSELQAQIKDLKEQERTLKEALDTADKNASFSAAPVPAPAPMRPGVAAMIGTAVGAAVCGAVLFAVWPDPVVAPAAPVATPAATTSTSALRGRALGEPVSIDGVDVVVHRARVAPVKLVSLSGEERESERPYLVFDVRLVNRSSGNVLLVQPWKSARVADDQGRTLRPAFAEAAGLDEVPGKIVSRLLKPGQEAIDLMVFEWADSNAAAFTLYVDPGFRRPTGEDASVELSNQSFTLVVPRDRVDESVSSEPGR